VPDLAWAEWVGMTDANLRTEASADVGRLVVLLDGWPDRDELHPYLSHPDPAVRQAAVEGVARLRPEWAFDALCLAMLDATDQVRVAAATSLRARQSSLPDQPQLFDFLAQALHSPSPLVREVAVGLLRRTSDASVATFAAASRDSEPRVRVEAVRALVEFRAVREIRRLAGDADDEVRLEVAKALTRLADAS
jgi:HEAT repeat protein